MLNCCVARRLWLAEELNKDKWKQDEKRIARWSQELKTFEEEFGRVEPMEGVLAQIQALFASQQVRLGAIAMRAKWDELAKLNEETMSQYNANDGLTKIQVSLYEAKRLDRMAELNRSSNDLLRDMCKELLGDVHPGLKK